MCRVNLDLVKKSSKPTFNYFTNSVGTEDDIAKNLINTALGYIKSKIKSEPKMAYYQYMKCKLEPDVYVFTIPGSGENPILSHLEIPHEVKSTYKTLVFLPVWKSDSKVLEALYVFSGGHSWRHMYQITDTEFLAAVPLRIANCEGSKCYKVRYLDSSLLSTETSRKKGIDLRDLDINSICTKFKASVSTDHNMSLGKSIQNFLIPSKKKIVFEVSEGCIKILANLTIRQLQQLVPKLEAVHKNYLNRFPISKESKLQRLTLRVHKELENDLKDKFLKDMNKTIRFYKSDISLFEKEFVDEYDIRYFDDKLMNSEKVHVYFTNEDKHIAQKEFLQVPSFKQVVRFFLSDSNIEAASPKQFLEHTELAFEENSKTKSGSLFSFLTGTFYFKNKFYHLLNESWYSISEDLICDTQRQFQDILKSDLIPEEDFLLTEHWDVNINEENYNKKYQNKPNYFVGDQQFIRNVEMCDVGFFSKDSLTYLFHNKRTKGMQLSYIRAVCSQVQNAYDMLNLLKKITPKIQLIFRNMLIRFLKKNQKKHRGAWKNFFKRLE